MIVAVLQARMTSTRFPGKVLKPILGKPMLWRQIERAMQADSIHKLVVATSTDPSDEPIVEFCRHHNVAYHRGSLKDVLERFYFAAEEHQPSDVVRLTGDCPLIDPRIIDQVILLHQNGHFDYTSNTRERTYPDGLDIEICRMSALERAYFEAHLPSEREHVTAFFYNHPERFRIGQLTQSHDYSQLRWTVDEPEDYELVVQIFEALYPQNPAFNQADILNFLQCNPELLELNAHFELNEGYLKSLQEDALFLQNR